MRLMNAAAAALWLCVLPGAAAAGSAGRFAVELSFEVDALPAADGGAPLPVPAAVELEAQINVDPQGLQLERLQLLAPGSEVVAHGRLDPGARRARLQLEIEAARLDLRPFLSRGARRVQRERLLPQAALPAGLLRTLEARLVLTVAQLVTPRAEFGDLRVPLTLTDGVLEVDAAHARLAGGELDAALVLAAAPAGSRMRAGWRLQARGIEPQQLPHAADRPWIEGLRTDALLEGSGSGASIADILAGADGRLYVQSGPGRLPDAYIDLVGANLFWDVFRRLTPFGGNLAQLDCSVMHFAVRDGIATTERGIVLQTADRTLVGSGEIDLQSESISLGLVTQQLGGGTGGNFARVEGTLAEPAIRVDPAVSFGAGVAAGTAIATGGLSLLARKLFSRGQADPEPCRTARGLGTN